MSVISTDLLIQELISRDGVQYMEAKKGQPLQFDAPEDCFLLVVPPDSMPHKETLQGEKRGRRSRIYGISDGTSEKREGRAGCR